MSSVWEPYSPSTSEPWNIERVVHLHRRAGFAANWQELQRDLKSGPTEAIDRLLQPAIDTSSPFEALAANIAEAATASGHAGRLKAWWLYRMLLSPDPLGERLTLMWHNHFATSIRKVQNLVWMREQNELLRAHARGSFAELLKAVIKHPAMLMWLDADSNRKGHPNENLARELMELFTLGIGNYTEDDVKEAARALTGWGIDKNAFSFEPKRHDDADKEVLGQRGRMTGDALIELLLQQPATAERVAWRICRTFLGEAAVTASDVRELASDMKGQGLDVKWGVETVLRSRIFFTAQNLHARILGPVEFIVGSLHALELTDPPPSTLLLAEWCKRMGQDLFDPPNVGGWSEGRAWLGTRTIVARANFATALAEGTLWFPKTEPPLEQLVKRHVGKGDLNTRAEWLMTLLWGGGNAAAMNAVVTEGEASSSGVPLLTAQILSRPEHFLA